MLDSAPSTLSTDEEDFECLVDEAYFTVLRMNGTHVCQLHTPANLGDVTMELGQRGFVVMDVYAEDGILELLLRPLGEVPVDDLVTEKRMAMMKEMIDEREHAYA